MSFSSPHFIAKQNKNERKTITRTFSPEAAVDLRLLCFPLVFLTARVRALLPMYLRGGAKSLWGPAFDDELSSVECSRFTLWSPQGASTRTCIQQEAKRVSAATIAKLRDH